MHPYLTEQIVRDHHLTLERDARRHRLAKAASTATAARTASPATAGFMPHVRERGRLRRAIAARLRPTPA